MQRTKRPFASVAQLVLVILLLVSLVMMGQQSSHVAYQVGLILLIGATFAQIAFGNIPPEAGFGRSMRLFTLYMGITVALFAVSILVAPLLIWLGR